MTQSSPHADHIDRRTMMGSEESRRLCVYCGESTALLYCRADSAKLCFDCDREVHSTNQLFTKHTRFLLCDSCHDSAATIFCEIERSVLCHNCDWETHSSGLVHTRRPVEGFTGCPSVSEILAFLGFEGDKGTGLTGDGKEYLGDSDGDDGLSNLLIWETPSFVSLDDLIVSGDKYDYLPFPAVDVPPPPKNRNATCGKHKEEILRQLRSLGKSKHNFKNVVTEPAVDLQFLRAEQKTTLENACAAFEHHTETTAISDPEAMVFHWFNDDGDTKNQNYLPSAFSSNQCDGNPVDINEQPDGGGLSGASGCHEGQPEDIMNSNSLSFLPRTYQHDLNTKDRESAISRYKEKRKSRRYDKQVRYESRKVRAESRTRIRGRFAKMDRPH